MKGKYFYFCIKCDKEHDLESKIGKKHYPTYVPLFAGVYTKTKPQEETKLRKDKS